MTKPCLFLSAWLIAALAPANLARSKDRPNIVFIFIDDMGFADPGCFGNPVVKTPRIDQLATEGIKLTNFYVNSPICSPSRVAVTTGQYPARWKIYSYLNSRAGNASRGMNNYLSIEAPTTARKLHAAGYATAHFGKWHMGGGRDVDDAPLPTEYGFDESRVAFEGLGDRILTNPKNSSLKLGHGKITFCQRWEKTERYTDLAINFIKRNRGRPFYVRLFPNDVHDPHVPKPDSWKKWEGITDNPYEQRFFAVLEALDVQIGRVIDTIDDLGLSERTLIVFTSDNGPTDWPKYYRNGGYPPGFTGPFFGRKWSLFEGGIHVPFIARWKGTIPAGVTDNSSLMSGIDLSPTFCAIAGVAAPGLDGVDRSSVLLGIPSEYPKAVFWQYGAPHAVLKPGKLEYQSPSFAVRHGEWKLLANPDGSDARLFHLTEDPGEKINLLSAHPERARQLQAKIEGWAAGAGLAFDGRAPLSPPRPRAPVSINGQIVGFTNQGVTPAPGNGWKFDGKSSLALDRSLSPDVAGKKWIRIVGAFEAESDNGVLAAQGGNRTGYTLYLQKGKLVFAQRAEGRRTEVSSPPLSPGAHTFDAFRHPDGGLTLKLDGREVGRAKGTGPFPSNPGDSMEIGADLIQPVGDYQSPNSFRGVIRDLKITYQK